MRIVLRHIVFVVGLALCGCDTPCYARLERADSFGGVSCTNASMSIVTIDGVSYAMCTCANQPTLDAGVSHD
jgi:hypothetical protein